MGGPDLPNELEFASEPSNRSQVQAKSSHAGDASVKPMRSHSHENVPDFLSNYGFAAENDILWRPQLRDNMPEMCIQVLGHNTVSGHTHYRLSCSLKRSGETTNWEKAIRLTHLRSGLHDPVQKALGSSYPSYFAGVQFAHHMRPSGTTARLDCWCQRLAVCITRRLVPPWFVAAALQLLGAPTPDATLNDEDSKSLHAAKSLAPESHTVNGSHRIHRLYDSGPPSEADATATTATPPAASAGASAAASDPDEECILPSPGSPCSSSTDFEGCPIADLDDL